MNDDKSVLYILMRNDMPSMNIGKAMAQASHASNQFIHSHKDDSEVKHWMKQTDYGFGTVIVLSATGEEVNEIDSICNDLYHQENYKIIHDIVTDPTYPYVVNKETYNLLSHDNMKINKDLDDNKFLLTRSAITCSYVFAHNYAIKLMMDKFKLF